MFVENALVSKQLDDAFLRVAREEVLLWVQCEADGTLDARLQALQQFASLVLEARQRPSFCECVNVLSVIGDGTTDDRAGVIGCLFYFKRLDDRTGRAHQESGSAG